MDPIQQLWDELDTAGPRLLPASSEPIGCRRIDGIGFFPIGSGLWGSVVDGVPPAIFPGGVMLLGNNFSNAAYADQVVKRGCEVELHSAHPSEPPKAGPTWRNLLDLLDRADVPREKCFFTNAYMALIRGSSNIGDLDLASGDPFEQWCQDFFVHQLDLVQPRAVVALGAPAGAFLSRAARGIAGWPQRSKHWKFAAIDRTRVAVSKATVDHHRLCVTAVVHPSYSKLNAGIRHYEGHEGPAAEAAMVRAVAAG